MEKTGVALWIENHLWQIIAGGMLLYGGYLTGTTTTGHRLTSLESAVGEIKEDNKTRDGKLELLLSRVERLDTLSEMERERRKDQ